MSDDLNAMQREVFDGVWAEMVARGFRGESMIRIAMEIVRGVVVQSGQPGILIPFAVSLMDKITEESLENGERIPVEVVVWQMLKAYGARVGDVVNVAAQVMVRAALECKRPEAVFKEAERLLQTARKNLEGGAR